MITACGSEFNSFSEYALPSLEYNITESPVSSATLPLYVERLMIFLSTEKDFDSSPLAE